MSEHAGKVIELSGYGHTITRKEFCWWSNLTGGIVEGTNAIDHLLTRAETAERERDEARASLESKADINAGLARQLLTVVKERDAETERVAESLERIETEQKSYERLTERYREAVLKAESLGRERDALRAQLEASTQPLEFTAEEREKAKTVYWDTIKTKCLQNHALRAAIDALCSGRRVARERDTADWSKLQCENAGLRHTIKERDAEVEELTAKVAELTANSISSISNVAQYALAETNNIRVERDVALAQVQSLEAKLSALESRLSASMPTREQVARVWTKTLYPHLAWEQVSRAQRWLSAADAVLALMPAAQPVARELTMGEVEPIWNKAKPESWVLFHNERKVIQERFTAIINACIRHVCTVAQSTPEQPAPDREKVNVLYLNMTTEDLRKQLDEYLAEYNHKEKVIELAWALYVANPSIDKEPAFKPVFLRAEKFLAAADAYRRGG